MDMTHMTQMKASITSSDASLARGPWAIARRAAALGVIAAALLGGAGCGTVQPYERGKLAHPTMTAGDMAGFGESHLRAISEGATGGSGGTGSGCGCN